MVKNIISFAPLLFLTLLVQAVSHEGVHFLSTKGLHDAPLAYISSPLSVFDLYFADNCPVPDPDVAKVEPITEVDLPVLLERSILIFTAVAWILIALRGILAMHYRISTIVISLPEKGVSVHWLKHGFLKEVKRAGFTEKSNIYDIVDKVIRKKGANIISPRDNEIGAAYVDCLKGINNVGSANILLSYCWNYSVGEIIESLDNYCRTYNKNPKQTFVWICCLCNNQHRFQNTDVPFEDLRQTFYESVMGIGHIVAMMAPWNQPYYLTRVWCIFELFTAHSNELEITVVMPPQEKVKIVEELVLPPPEKDLSMEGFVDVTTDKIDTLFKALAGTSIENAKATKTIDKTNIMKMVQEGGGATKLNIAVNQLLREWVIQSLETTVNDERRKHQFTVDFANLCDSVGRVMFAVGRHKAAKELYDEANDIRVKLPGEQHISYAVSHCNNIGDVLIREGNFDGALELYNRSLSLNQKAFGDQSKETADSKREIGVILSRKGDYEESLATLKNALSTYESVLKGDENVECGLTNNGIGTVLYKTGDLDGALSSFKHGLDIFEKVLGEDHVQTARSHRHVGSILGKQGQIDDSLKHLQQGLQIFEEKLGDHRETGLMHNALGGTYRESNSLDKALDEFRKGLDVYEKVLEEDNKDTADTYNNIGTVLWKKGDLNGALQEHTKSLEMRQKLFGECSHKAAISHEHLGLVYYSKGLHEDAQRELNTSLDIKIKLLGEDHPSTASSYTSLGLVLDKMKDHEDALDCFKKAEKVQLSALGDEHPEYAKSEYLIGTVLKKQGELDDATEYLQRAFEVQERTLGREHPSTRKTLRCLKSTSETSVLGSPTVNRKIYGK